MLAITKPTLLLDEGRVRRNVARMVAKARRGGVRFRPHFKTHQSVQIGEWLREAGVEAITVSSVDMATYFARHGWQDITIAFPVNLRQLPELQALARRIRLGLLVEAEETAWQLGNGLDAPAELWIELDEGSGRSGLAWQQTEALRRTAEAVRRWPQLSLRGLLTHAGRIYAADSPEQIRQVYHQTVERLNAARQALAEQGIGPLEVSTGDTPGCTLVAELGAVDEIRPGNFVFYDGQQLRLGVCTEADLAAVVACPVVAKYPQRQEVVLYGGAVHLSKDSVAVAGQTTYGQLAFLRDRGWSELLPGGYLARLSQEHGVAAVPEPALSQVQVGGVLAVLPAHICLTVSALGVYQTLDGTMISTMLAEGLH